MFRSMVIFFKRQDDDIDIELINEKILNLVRVDLRSDREKSINKHYFMESVIRTPFITWSGKLSSAGRILCSCSIRTFLGELPSRLLPELILSSLSWNYKVLATKITLTEKLTSSIKRRIMLNIWRMTVLCFAFKSSSEISVNLVICFT